MINFSVRYEVRNRKTAQEDIEFNMRNYVEYVFINEGNPIEKGELLGILKDKLVVKPR